MSTEIKVIEGTYHKRIGTNISLPSTLYITRFYNGELLGTNIQVTVVQSDDDASYIHLTKEQCHELGQTLLDAFDTDKYPSE